MPLKRRPNPRAPRPRRRLVQALPMLASEARSAEKNAAPVEDPQQMRRHLAMTTAPTPQRAVRETVDRYCGIDGETIIKALAVLALGNAASRMTFFGEPVKVQARDRTQALSVLADRRWGRVVPEVDEGPGGRMPVQIINVFAELPEEP